MLRFALVILAPMLGVRAEEAKTAAPAAPDEVRLLADFRGGLPDIFSYGTWKGALAVSKNGMVVQAGKGAQGAGGLGRNLEAPIDLSQEVYVELGMGIGQKNEVPEAIVALNDADGTQVAARLRIDQIMPEQPVWFRLRRADFQRVSGQDGKDSKMDWTKVAQWHVQGDWNTKKPFQAVLIALRTRR